MGKEAGFLPKISTAPSLDEIPNFYKILFLAYQPQSDSTKDKKNTLEQFPLSIRGNSVDQASSNESDLSKFADYICSLNIINMNNVLKSKTLVLLEQSQPYIEAYQQSTSGKKEKEAIIQNCHMLGFSNDQTLELLNQSLKNYYKAIEKNDINYFGQEASSNLSSDSNDNKNSSKNLENKIIYLIKAFHLRYRQTTEILLSCENQLKQEIPNHKIPILTLIQLLKKIYIYPPTFYPDLIKKRIDYITLEVIDYAIEITRCPEKWIDENNKKAKDLKKQYPHATNHAIFRYATGCEKIGSLISSEKNQIKKQTKLLKTHSDKPPKKNDSGISRSHNHPNLPPVTQVDPILKQKYQASHHPLLTDIVIDKFLNYSQPEIKIERAKSIYGSLVETFKEKIKKNNTILLAITEACLSNEDDSVSFVSRYIARFDSFIKSEKYSNILPSIIASNTIRLITKEITLEEAISILNYQSTQW